jgi:hypothetical protein
MGLDKPSRVIFCINTNAAEVFSKSSLRKLFVLTTLPMEFLNSILRDEIAEKVSTNKSKKALLKGCWWLSKPDRWQGGHNVNRINFLMYIGTKDYSLKPDVNLRSLEVQTFMRIVHMKNILLSRNLATTGTGHIPLDLMSLAYQNPPN